jgi:hypothetical protein
MASLLEAIAAATFATAVFSDPIPRRVADFEPDSQTEILNRVVSLDWSSDHGNRTADRAAQGRVAD